MKTIGTLLLSFTLATAAFAQTDAEREEARRIILGERRESGSYPKPNDDRDVIYRDDRTVYGSSRARRAYEINREYDAKVYSIRTNRTLDRYERERIIRQLETERRRKLAAVTGGYNGRDRRYDGDDDCDDNDNRNKKRNGNRYGWYKNTGNPHNRK